MKLSIVLGTAALLSLPAFAQTDGKPADVAAAERIKLITSVQEELGVTVDGKMGPATHEAIEKFQRSKGIDATGQLDKKTITAMGLGGAKPSASAGASARPKTGG
ncbi:MAG: peptidoglycan-binding protein [Betaproteobacteria bacterium]|nr:peptidoglycan-binding protein [Betaproteobacteria bacterium]